MKDRIYIIILMMILAFFSCNGAKEHQKKGFGKNEISKTWNDFLNILESNNITSFKELASKKIHCYLCLENTDTERKKMDIMRNSDSLWYDKVYDDLVYIPIESFVKKDFHLIFNSKFVKTLKEKVPMFHKRIIDGIECYEVLVTTTERTIGNEGGQHNFQFKKINGKWKFNEIGTIP